MLFLARSAVIFTVVYNCMFSTIIADSYPGVRDSVTLLSTLSDSPVLWEFSEWYDTAVILFPAIFFPYSCNDGC